MPTSIIDRPGMFAPKKELTDFLTEISTEPFARAGHLGGRRVARALKRRNRSNIKE